MDENIDDVLVFATNIKTIPDKEQIHESLQTNTGIITWSIDQQDVDCVLRVVTKQLSVSEIITIIENHNFICKELE